MSKISTATVIALLLGVSSPATSYADAGLLRTIHALDEARGYCLDIAGEGQSLRLDAALQELALFGGDVGKRVHGKGLETLGQRRHCVLHSRVILVMEKYAPRCLDMHSAAL